MGRGRGWGEKVFAGKIVTDGLSNQTASYSSSLLATGEGWGDGTGEVKKFGRQTAYVLFVNDTISSPVFLKKALTKPDGNDIMTLPLQVGFFVVPAPRVDATMRGRYTVRLADGVPVPILI